MKILLVGHGRMGRLVESLAGEYGGEVVGIIDSRAKFNRDGAAAPRWRDVDVAIDVSTGDAVAANVPALALLGVPVVIGTTGWQQHEAAVRKAIAAAGVGVVASANFSVGVILFDAIVRRAAALLAAQPEFGAWVHDAHHAAKKDAPSGTALMLRAGMERAGYHRAIDISSTRAGHIPGTHTVGFDGPVETITLTHTARDRSGFARGALTAAQWVRGRTGWFTMADVLGLTD
jgi:4-hydroxy-tetrahydrodipicolinate reductase